MPAVISSQNQYAVSPTWTAVDFGLNSALDTDAETVTTLPAYASYYSSGGTGRPPDQRTSIASSWSSRQTSPSTIGQGAEDWINLMNQVGISVGDVAVAVGITTTEVRSYILANTYWTPLATSSKDIQWAQQRGTPVGTFESFVGGGDYYLSNEAYIRFYNTAPYASKSYTATWTLSRFTNQLKYVGPVQTIPLDKSYNIASFSSLGGYVKSGNIVFAESMWNIPSGGAVVSAAPVVIRGSGDTDYSYQWSVVGSTTKQPVGFADSNAQFTGSVPPIPSYEYQLWSADGDFAIGTPRASNTSYVPDGFTGGGGGGGSTQLTAAVTVSTRTLTKSVAASFAPVAASGGTSPYVYTITPFPPIGLSLNQSTGTISGTPTSLSSATIYTVSVTDSNLSSVSGNFTLSVVDQGSINPDDLSSLSLEISNITDTLDNVKTTLDNVNNTLDNVKNTLDNMPDYTIQLDKIAAALETIAENSTLDSENLGTVANTLDTNINVSLSTVASKMAEIEQYQKKLKELSETTGIHIRGPYEELSMSTLYKLLIEQAKILDDTDIASEADKALALAKLNTYIDKIKGLQDF